MPKKQTISAKPKRSWLKYGLLTMVAFAVMGLVIYSGYQAQQEKAEANRFAALQSDFKKLQVEFNKIDPGWEYKEGCRGQGGVYTSDVPSGCEVGLYASRKVTNNNAQYVTIARKTVRQFDAQCVINFDDDGESYVRCSHEAHRFYFQRLN